MNKDIEEVIKDLTENNMCGDYCGHQMDKAIATIKWLNERVKELEASNREL